MSIYLLSAMCFAPPYKPFVATGRRKNWELWVYHTGKWEFHLKMQEKEYFLANLQSKIIIFFFYF